MFVDQIDRIFVAPRRIVRTPGLDVADNHNLGILLPDGLVEHVVALHISYVACLIVLVAHFNEFQIVRFGMTVGNAARTPFGRSITVGILDGVETILHECLGLFERQRETVAQTYVDHKHRGGSKVLGQLQIFVIAKTVARAVAPVLVHVARSLLDGAYCLFPLESIVVRAFTLHIASSGETEKRGTGIGKQLGKVGTQTVGTAAPCARKQ